MGRVDYFRKLQLAGATAVEAAIVLAVCDEIDVIELAWRDAWRHEKRGPGGRWSGSEIHPSAVAVIKPVSHVATRTHKPAGEPHHKVLAAARGRAISGVPLPASMDTEHHNAAEMIKAVSVAEARKEARDMVEQLRQEHSTEIARLRAQVQLANQHIADVASKQESSKARVKTLAVVASLVGGAMLGYVETRFSVPDPLAFASSISPGVAEALFEGRKHL